MQIVSTASSAAPAPVELSASEIDEVAGGLMLQAFGYFACIERLPNGRIMYGYGEGLGVGHWGSF